MKKIILSILILQSSVMAFSQKLSADKVPQIVKSGLIKIHPAAQPSWEWEDKNYEANFTENGKEVSCVVDKHGTILETETSITLNELPAVAQTYVGQHYKGKKAKEIAKISKANGAINYEVNYGGGDVLFDQTGNRITKKEKKD